jgi:hypothetical protein
MTEPTQAAFAKWIGELRYEASLVFSNFNLYPEDWRHEFEKGRTPSEALECALEMLAASQARRRLH